MDFYINNLSKFRIDELNSGFINYNNQFTDIDLKWKFESGDFLISSPITLGNTVFIASCDGFLYSLNIDSKILNWKFKTHGQILSTPLIFSDSIYLSSYDNCFYSINITTGHQNWKQEIGWSYSSPIIWRNLVLIGVGDGVVGLDMKSGNISWFFQTKFKVFTSPAILNNIIYFAAEYTLYGVNLEDKSIVLIKDYDSPIISSPVINENYLYVIKNGERSRAVLYCINLTTSEIVWSQDILACESSPSVDKNLIFTASYDGYLRCFEKYNGKLIWKYKADGAIQSSPLGNEVMITFGDYNGVIYLLNKKTGKELWRFKTAGMIQSSPSMSQNCLFVSSNDKCLYCFQFNKTMINFKSEKFSITEIEEDSDEAVAFKYSLFNNTNSRIPRDVVSDDPPNELCRLVLCNYTNDNCYSVIIAASAAFYYEDGTYFEDKDESLRLYPPQCTTFRNNDQNRCVKKIKVLIGYIISGQLKAKGAEITYADPTKCLIEVPLYLTC